MSLTLSAAWLVAATLLLAPVSSGDSVAPPASAGDSPGSSVAEWPQYRGVHRDGAAPVEVGWPEGGPKVSWRLPIGSAFSQLAVRGDAVLTGMSEDGKEYLVRLDAATGKEVWRVQVGEMFTFEFGNGPRSTPTLDGDRVYFLGAKGKLVAVKAADGSEVWNVNLTESFGSQAPRYGYSASPLVVDGLVLLEAGGKEEASLVALDKKTGEVKWSVLSGPAGYCSPILLEIGGIPQVVMVRVKTVTSLDLEGKVLWTHELQEPAIAMPVNAGDGRIFVSSAGDTGCAMLRIKKTGGGFEVEELWKNRNMRNHFNSSVVHGAYIYGFDNATLKCLSVETGELVWAKRGFGKGSLIVAGQRLIVLSDKGKVAVADATPDGYHERGSFQALEGRSWTAPSLAGGRLYLRNLTEMTCLDLRS